MSIKVDEINLEHLFSTDFWFNIPNYQRPYVWGEDNINDLLDDIVYAFENNSEDKYFLGSLVLQNKGNNEYDILDGQQRLTTICLILTSLRDEITREEIKNNIQNYLYKEKDFIKKIEDKPKLNFEIRGEVQEFFNNYVIRKDGTKEFEEYKNENKNISIFNMKKAIRVIKIFIENYFNKNENKIEDEEILNFITFIMGKLIFAYVCSDSREQAFRLFTILNNRGVPLTTGDILKSLNLKEILNENEKNVYAKMWEELERKFDDKFDRFLNFIRTIKLKEKARKNLLEEFEEKIYKNKLIRYGKETFDYIKNTADNYDKIISFEFNTDNISNEYRNLVTIMKVGFNSEDWIPPLLFYYEKFKVNGLVQFTKLLDNKFMGDWINRETPTKRLESMNKILKYIENTDNYLEILENKTLFEFDKEKFLKEIDGEVFGQRYCKYLLLKIEYLKLDRDTSDMMYINDYKNISIEHILPQNPKDSSEWKKIFTEDERKEWTNKIGNLMLLTKRKNSQLSNLEFKDKKIKYSEKNLTIFPSTNDIYLKSDEWNTKTLLKRQEDLKKLFK